MAYFGNTAVQAAPTTPDDLSTGFFSSLAKKLGAGDAYAAHIAPKLTNLTHFTPLGIPQAAYEGGQQMGLGAKQGSEGNVAAGAGNIGMGAAMAAMSALPGGAAENAAKEGLVSIKGLAGSFKNAIENHLSLAPGARAANSKDAAARVAKYVGMRKDGTPVPLLGQNAKLMKAGNGYDDVKPLTLPDGSGVETTGLALAPSYQEGKFNTCPNSASCAASCLGKTSGNYFKLGGGTDLSEFKGPRLNSLNKTTAFMRDPEAFAVRLNDEITSAKAQAAANGNRLGVRLNVLSDINPQVHKSIIEAHPDVAFYDYTKNNTNPIAPNHHYTYSSTGVSQPKGINGIPEAVDNPNSNWTQMRKRLDTGSNVAMAFSHKDHLPDTLLDHETGNKYTVVDGDTHDFRPLDAVAPGQTGVVIGLKNKKSTGKVSEAAKDSQGFFVHYDPQLKMNENGTYERGPSPGISPTTGKPMLGPTIPQNRVVEIANQKVAPKTLTNDMVPLK